MNRGLHVLMTPVVRVVERELPQGGEVAFDPVEPARAGRREVELDAMRGGVLKDLGFEVEAGVVEDDVQNFGAAVAGAEPLEELQERRPVLLLGEGADERVAFQARRRRTGDARLPCGCKWRGDDRRERCRRSAYRVGAGGSAGRTRRC